LGEKINIAVTVTNDGKGEANETTEFDDQSLTETPNETKGGTGRNSTSLNIQDISLKPLLLVHQIDLLMQQRLR
jgi:hypothetical protein